MTLKTLDEYNAERRKERDAAKLASGKPNGISCPKCRHEMHDTYFCFFVQDNPPRTWVHCPACGHKDYRLLAIIEMGSSSRLRFRANT